MALTQLTQMKPAEIQEAFSNARSSVADIMFDEVKFKSTDTGGTFDPTRYLYKAMYWDTDANELLVTTIYVYVELETGTIKAEASGVTQSVRDLL